MDKKTKKLKKKKKEEPVEETEKEVKPGFPEDVDFKKFLGCGG
ncbi:hypothetical protein [Ekhidna sp.]